MKSNPRHAHVAIRGFVLLLPLVLLWVACNPVPPAPRAAPPEAPAPVDGATPALAAPSATPGGDLRLVNAPSAPLANSSETPTATATAAPAARAEPARATAEPSDFLPRRLPTEPPVPTATRRPAVPTPTRPANVRELRVPILMYHYVSVPPPDADAIRMDLSVTPERFEEQMAYFASQGYQTVSLQALYDAVAFGKPLPRKPIVFTFDDGYADAYLNAVPILKRYNFGGTFYVITGFVGRKGYLTWPEVVEMAREGMDIQSHSVLHTPMKGRTSEALRQEMLGSKRALEQATGNPVNFFCYPSGQYDALAIDVLKETGYLSAVTTKPGAWQNEALPYEWPRVRVRGRDTLPDLVKRVVYPE